MANEFVIKNGFHSKGDSQITGSVNVSSTGSFGYLSGDGSGLTGVTPTLPSGLLSGSAQISSDISGSFTEASGGFSTRVTALEEPVSASYVNPLNQTVRLTGSLDVQGTISSTSDIFTGGNLDGSGLNLNGSARISTDGGSLRFLNDLDTTGANINGALITGSFFKGDGSALTNVPATLPSGVVSSSAQVNSGSFSGSFNGNGSNLTDVPVNITNTLWVSTSGDNATAEVGNINKPWASVSASLTAISNGDLVLLEPGVFIEPPFTVPTGVTVKSLGGLKSTTISASNNSARFITQEANTRLEGFTLVCPSGSFAGIFYDNVGSAAIYDVTLKGQGDSIGFQISQSTAATSKVIYNEIRFGGGNFDTMLSIQGGILACDGIHVPGGGNIDKIYHMEAGRLQAINTNAGNPNVSSSFYIEGGTSVILGTNLFNVQEAFRVAGQPYIIQAMNVYVDDNVPKHLTVDAGISGSDSQINFVGAHMEAAKISATPDFVGSDHAFTFQDDGVNLKPAFRVYTDLEVGHANKGFTLGTGEGLHYNKGMQIWASGSGAVTQDLTDAVVSKDGSTFNFPYSASGDSLYFGNQQKSPSIADQYLYFTGLQYKQLTTGSLAFGDFTLEIYTTASTWEGVSGAQCVSAVEGYNYANNIFAHENSEEEIIANVKTDTWATSSIFGVDARWARIRLLNPVTTSPIFEQFLYTPDTTLINPKGQVSFRGKALSRVTFPIVGNTWGDTGLANPTFNNIGADATWDHRIMNTRMNNVADFAYNQMALPAGVCTAFPMKIQISFRASAAETAVIDVALVQQTGVKVNDPTGGKIPTARTTANTTDFDDAAVPITTFSIAVPDTNNTIEMFELSPVDISSFYEGDLLLIRVNSAAAAGNLDIVDTNLSFVKWTVGERNN